MIKVGVVGAAGNMGSLACAWVEAADGLELVARVDQGDSLAALSGADVAVDCAGVPSVLPEGLEMLRKGGTYIECGAFVEMGTVPISPHRHLCSKSVRLIGMTNHPYTGYDAMLRQLEIYGDAMDMTSIITDSFAIKDADAALHRSMETSSGKVLIDARL